MDKFIKIDCRCTGCGLCEKLCPREAISMEINSDGFWYPQVNREQCVNCGLCQKQCPVYGDWKAESFFGEPKSYACWNKKEDIRFYSSSGGLFSAIAETVLDNSGVVYGAAYMGDFSVEHIRVDTQEGLCRLRGSKYVQSLIRPEIFELLEKDLISGKQVLFSGTPCQVAAVVHNYGNYANLITVDIICHGVPSPGSWKHYLAEEKQKHGAIRSINMREKTNGWNRFHFVMEFQNGQRVDHYFNDNLWGKSFVCNLFLRESCYHCEFKKKIRSADISLGDFWEAARGVHREYDDGDKGTSVVLVNSQKGKAVMGKIENCNIQEIPYEYIPEKTYAIMRSSFSNPKRERAFKLLNKGKPFSFVVARCTRRSLLQKVAGKAKRIMQRIIKRKGAE